MSFGYAKSGWVGLIVSIALTLLAADSGTRAGTTTIAISGDAAPGGGTFSSLNGSLVYLSGSSDSMIGFTASIGGVGTTTLGGIFRSANGGTQMILRNGMSIDGVTPTQVSLGGIDSLGVVTGGFGYSGGSAVFASNAAGSGSLSVSVLARNGLAAPGGGSFGSVVGPVVSNGKVAFTGNLNTGTGSSTGAWGKNIVSAGALTEYIRGGSFNIGGATLNLVGIGSTSITDTGDVVLDSGLSGSANHTLLRFGGAGSLEIARSGSLTPGGGGSFAAVAFKSPLVAQNGAVTAAFIADLNTATGASQGLYRGSSYAGLVEVARKGSSTGVGTFDSFQSFDLNRANQIAFRAAENFGGAGPRSGIWRVSGAGTTLTKIAVPGDPAPGGATFSSAGIPQMNSAGLVAFDGSAGSAKGIYLGDGSETIQAIGTGSALLGSTLSTFDWNYQSDRGGQSPIDDYGQLAFSANLANGKSAVLLYTPDLHWRPLGTAGDANDVRNWTLSIRPNVVHDVFFDPAISTTGNNFGRRSIKSLTVGGGAGIATLSVSSLYLNIQNALTITNGGRLTWSSTDQLTAGPTVNNGSFTQNAGSVNLAGVTGAGSMAVTGTGVMHADFIRQNQLMIFNGGKLFLRPNGTEAATSVISGFFTADVGSIDLANNSFVHDYTGTSSVNSIGFFLKTGYNNGAWNGGGINSSTAAATPGTALGFAEAGDLFTTFPAMFRGVSVDSTAVLIRYTRYGDANLDGSVDTTDFNFLAANFAKTGTRWSKGDFNYDGSTDTTDFNLLASNFGTMIGAAEAGSLVPEPVGAAVLMVLAIFSASRSRRRYPVHPRRTSPL